MKSCSKCGSQSSDSAMFCEGCGNGFTVTPVQQPPVYTAPQQNYPPQPQGYAPPTGVYSQPNNYHQMGGWLLCFMILCILDAVIGFFSTIFSNGLLVRFQGLFSYFGSISLDSQLRILFLIFGGLVTIVAVVLEIIFVVQVFKRDSRFLLFYQICKIVATASILITSVFSGSAFRSFENASNTIFTFFFSIAGFALMTLYYSKSVRVRTYMGNDEYLRKALFTKNMVSPVPASGYTAPPPFYPTQQPPVQAAPAPQPSYTPSAPVYSPPSPPQPAAVPIPPTVVEFKNVFCVSCGNRYSDNDSHCSKCGAGRQ